MHMKSFDMIVNIDVHYLRSSSFYSLYEYFSDANLHNLLEFPTNKTQKSSINEPWTGNSFWIDVFFVIQSIFGEANDIV